MHIVRIDKAIVIRVNQETAGWQRFCLGDKRRQIGNAPFFQHALEQPQTHNVFQYPITPFRAAFVGDIGGQRLVSGVRFLLSKPINDRA